MAYQANYKLIDSCTFDGDKYEVKQSGSRNWLFCNGSRTPIKDVAKWIGMPSRTLANRISSGHPLSACLLPKGRPYWSDARQVGARIHRAMLESMNESDKVIGRLDPLVGIEKKSAEMLRVKL